MCSPRGRAVPRGPHVSGEKADQRARAAPGPVVTVIGRTQAGVQEERSMVEPRSRNGRLAMGNAPSVGTKACSWFHPTFPSQRRRQRRRARGGPLTGARRVRLRCRLAAVRAQARGWYSPAGCRAFSQWRGSLEVAGYSSRSLPLRPRCGVHRGIASPDRVPPRTARGHQGGGGWWAVEDSNL